MLRNGAVGSCLDVPAGTSSRALLGFDRWGTLAIAAQTSPFRGQPLALPLRAS